MKRVILFPYNNASRPTDLADGKVIPFASWQMNKIIIIQNVLIVKKKGHTVKCTSL
jgi:hypothetical protein